MPWPGHGARGLQRVFRLSLLIAAAALAFAAASTGGTAAASSVAASSRRASAVHWVGVWSASPSDASVLRQSLSDQTLRMVVDPHYGGRTLRLHLSNRFGSSSITLNRVEVALRGRGAAVGAGSSRIVRFRGSRGVRIPNGKDVVSDAVSLSFRPFQELVVSVYIAGVINRPTEHFTTRQTNYLSSSGSGDHTADHNGSAFTQTTAQGVYSTGWYFLDEIDAQTAPSDGAVVAFGDSITDGFQGNHNESIESQTGVNANGRYPDDLARRLLAAHRALSVLNAGISGNRVLRGSPLFGPSGQSRLRRDVIDLAGVRDVIVLEGINDIGQAPSATSAEIIAGLKRMILRLRRAGLHALVGTLTPTGGTGGFVGTPAANKIRKRVNAWIRSQHLAEVIDFDKAVRDPRDPSRIYTPYDDSDHIHLSLTGYRAMASAIKLSELK